MAGPVELSPNSDAAYGFTPSSSQGIEAYSVPPERLPWPRFQLSGARHEYTYIAATLIGDLPITDLPLRDVQFSWGANKPGNFSASVQVPVFSRSQDYFYGTQPGRSVIYVFRDGIPIWGGIVWKRSFDSEARVIKIEGDTFDSYMYHRILDQDMSFQRNINATPLPIYGTDQTDMFRFLWAHMSGDWEAVQGVMSGLPVPYRRGGNIGVVLAASPNRTTFRGRTFTKTSFDTYGQHLETLANLKNGFQWFSNVVAAPEGVASVSGVQRRIEFGFPTLGRPYSETGFVWEFPANMLSYTWTGDADKGTTHAFVLGTGEGDLRAYAHLYNTQRLEEGWPLIDTSHDHSTVSSLDTMNAHASKYLRAFDPPVGEFDLTTHPDMPPTFGPEGGEHYFLGDEIAVKIDDDVWNMAGVRPEDLFMMIDGITVSPNDDGLEDVKPEVSIKARNTYIGPEEEDGADQAGDPPNSLPTGAGTSVTGFQTIFVQAWGEYLEMNSEGGGWGGSRP